MTGRPLKLVPFPEDERRVRQYYKYELAQLYRISTETLIKYINRFLPEFEALGYRKHDKLLTKEMVRLVFSLLGEP